MDELTSVIDRVLDVHDAYRDEVITTSSNSLVLNNDNDNDENNKNNDHSNSEQPCQCPTRCIEVLTTKLILKLHSFDTMECQFA